MTDRTFDTLRDKGRAEGTYQLEKAKLDFAAGVWTLMERNGINQSALAERVGKSAPWISKALRGDWNFTIETMVAIALASGGELCIHVADKRARTRVIEVHDGRNARVPGTWSQGIAARAEGMTNRAGTADVQQTIAA